MTEREEITIPAVETVADQEATKYSKILVGIDGSACSLHAARHAVYLAAELGAELFALNAINVERAFHAGIHFGEAVAELEGLGKKALRDVKDIAAEKGVRCEEMPVRGRPHKALIEASEDVGVDLIIVGSTGMTSVERVLLGSESEKVVHYAKCPVLVVREL
jgi:nucleotide-binding universal stress UspA family protein